MRTTKIKKVKKISSTAKKKEKEDNEGMRRKTNKPEMSLNRYYLIKSILVVAILISFFSYSVFLLPLFLAYASLYYFSTWAERRINRQYNKENKKRLFKLDASLSAITIIVSLSSAFYSFSTMVGNRVNSIQTYFYRIMSLSTGIRKKGSSSMGFGGKPDGFTKPSGGGGSGMENGRPPRPDFDMNDLPIEFAFNQILSSIVQILVFSVIILGTISILIYVYKNFIKKKNIKIKENVKNEWTFSKEDLIKLLEEKI